MWVWVASTRPWHATHLLLGLGGSMSFSRVNSAILGQRESVDGMARWLCRTPSRAGRTLHDVISVNHV